jgi:hypothetical protein
LLSERALRVFFLLRATQQTHQELGRRAIKRVQPRPPTERLATMANIREAQAHLSFYPKARLLHTFALHLALIAFLSSAFAHAL